MRTPVEQPSLRPLAKWELGLEETSLEAIIPAGGGGYALNSRRQVVGLKFILHSNAAAEIRSIFDEIQSYKSLKRLVFAYFHETLPLDIPDSLADLQNLEFLWLGGSIRSLPSRLLRQGIPVFVSSRASSEGSPEYRELDGLVSAAESFGRETTSGVQRDPVEMPAAALQERVKRYFSEQSDAARRSRELRGIYLDTATLADPPLEIVAKGNRALAAYLSDRQAVELPLNEVKVILVGDGGAGKTSLVKRLVGDRFMANEPQTHGINIRQWVSNSGGGAPVKIHLWDFGGQEIMHATHQFFLSQRSLYVVLLDGRKEEEAEYWLQHVESFGGNSPVLIAINKIDQNPSYDVNRKFLRDKYPFIVGFYKISCKSKGGVSEFKSALEEAVRVTSILSTRWPISWFRVKEHLEGSSSTASYISLGGFTSICESQGVIDKNSQDVLVDFLHDLGVIVHFRDFHLLDTHVLNPRWVTEGVYRIINSKIVAENRGLLKLTDLDVILKDKGEKDFVYPKDKYGYLVELMLKFELCYRIDDRSILIPDLLDIQEPPIELNYDDSIRFVFEYDYLPKSVMPRFIVRMNLEIKNNMMWRTGVVLDSASLMSTALIRSDENAKKIYLFVFGSQKREYFAIIRQAFHEIHRTFQKLPLKELVPLPDDPSILVEYAELLGYERGGREEIYVGRLNRGYKVKTLLNGLVNVEQRKQEERSIHISGDYIAGNQIVQEIEKVTDSSRNLERMLVLLTAIAFVGLSGFLLVRNTPFSDPNLVVMLRVILSVMVAALGATVPGMLNVGFTRKGIAIRAAGAIALFVLALLITPSVVR